MTQTTDNYDPFEAAMEAEAPSGPRTVFGEVQVDVWPCVLRKGEGKIPFDPSQHSIDERRTAIDITLIPTRGDYNIERHLIAESTEWAKIVKPSLREIGIDLRALNGKFVQAQLVPTGRTYVNAQGETKENTTFKFVAVYPDMESCIDAANEFFKSRGNGGNGDSQPAPVQTQPVAPAQNNRERETALKFVPALWKSAGGDINKLAELLANNPLTKKYFDINSPEVVALVSGQAA